MNELNELSVLGNTNPERVRFRKACFTLNNYTNEEITQILKEFDRVSKGYVIGDEVGDQGVPHLQGYVEFKTQKYLSGLKKICSRAHWEKALGNRKQNIQYCSKQKIMANTFPRSAEEKYQDLKDKIMQKKYTNAKWKDWQQDIVNKCEDAIINEREINWYWEPKGNIGKTFMAKYLALKYNAIIGEGKKADVFNQIKSWMDANPGESPRVIMLDIPRTNLDYINFGAIEQIKNGLLYSGKYEGGVLIFEEPLVFIFANSPPDTECMSEDRWNIVKIGLDYNNNS